MGEIGGGGVHLWDGPFELSFLFRDTGDAVGKYLNFQGMGAEKRRFDFSSENTSHPEPCVRIAKGFNGRAWLLCGGAQCTPANPR